MIQTRRKEEKEKKTKYQKNVTILLISTILSPSRNTVRFTLYEVNIGKGKGKRRFV